MSVESKQSKKRSGFLFIAAGLMFFIAAYFGGQPGLAGVGVAFIGISIAFLRKTK